MGIFGDLKQGFKLGMELSKRSPFEEVPLIKTLELGYEKRINVVVDPLLCNARGFKVCACFDCIGSYLIAFDNSFYNISENCKKFIILHELGHIAHRHLTQKSSLFKRIFKSIFSIKNQMEIDADAYAVNLMGVEKSLDALNELKALVGDKEIDLRIAEIK